MSTIVAVTALALFFIFMPFASRWLAFGVVVLLCAIFPRLAGLLLLSAFGLGMVFWLICWKLDQILNGPDAKP